MSDASAAHIEAGAQLAAVLAAQLARQPGQALTAGSVADILGSIAGAVPALAAVPQVSLAFAFASIALRAFHAATTVGTGLTAEQRAALIADDDAAIAADRAAHPA